MSRNLAFNAVPRRTSGGRTVEPGGAALFRWTRGLSNRCAAVVAALAVALVVAGPVQATPITLIDDNSSLTLNTTVPSGAFDWIVDGVNQLKRQNFYFRVGNSGPEQSLDTLVQGPSGAFDTNFSGTFDTFFVRYFGPDFEIDLTYRLNGGVAGSQTSSIVEQVSITNTGNSAIDFNLFKYADFDLAGTVLGDTVEFVNVNTIQQWDGLTRLETVTTPAATRREATFNGSTLAKLMDPTNPDNLSNTPLIGSPLGPSDVVWALQWTKKIDPGGTFNIDIGNSVMIPEPSTLALMTIGLFSTVVYGGRRRARGKRKGN